MDDSITTGPVMVSGDGAPASGSALKWILVLLLAAGVAFMLWWTSLGSRSESQAANAEVQRLGAQVATLEHTLAQLRGSADTLRSRLDDGDKVDQSVREQLLRMGERTRLLEDSIANFADRRLSGRDTLALDEAELLLTIGGDRFALFHDSAAAVSAYRLADTALGEVQDAAFAGVRQSIGAEIAALTSLPSADPAALAARLLRLAASISALPLVRHAAQPAGEDSGLAHFFGGFVQIHHDDEAGALARTTDAALGRELALLDLHQAQAAALARDASRYHEAVAAAQGQLRAAFDSGSVEVAAVLAEFDDLAKVELAPPAPAVLGTALKELHSLRASRALQAPPDGTGKAEGSPP